MATPHGAESANGHIFKRGDTGAATNFNAVSYLRSVTIPAIRPIRQTVTVHTAQAVQTKGTIIEIPAFAVEVNHNLSDTQQAGMMTDVFAITERYYQIEEEDGSTWTGPAELSWEGETRTPENVKVGNWMIHPTDLWAFVAG